MAKFIFKIEEYDDGFRKIDEFEEWISAYPQGNAG